MSRYLLDTTALIDFSKGREPARSRILQIIEDGDELGVCAVNVAEFYAGLGPDERAAWDEFFDAIQYWDITLGAARLAGHFYYEFERRGKVISTTDSLIAAVAMERAAVIVTNNVRDYPMEGIHLLPLQQ